MIIQSRARKAFVHNLAAVLLIVFSIGLMLGLAWTAVANGSPTTPGLPTPPPPLPTQVTNGDGTRVNCTPHYEQCWPAH